jgi:hypothetical protein
MAKRKRQKLFRIEGTPEKLQLQGSCRRCSRIGELYGAITNQGYLHICSGCMASGMSAGKKDPLPPHGKNKANDLMTYCVPGSFGGGKKR